MCLSHGGVALSHNYTSVGELADGTHLIIANGKIHLGTMSLQCRDTKRALSHAHSSKHDQVTVPMGDSRHCFLCCLRERKKQKGRGSITRIFLFEIFNL